MNDQQIIIRRTQLPTALGLSIATIDRLRSKGQFVPEVELGEQAIGFRQSDVEAWIASRVRVTKH